MIRFLVDFLFADVMQDYILIEEMVYIPFDSLADCICRTILVVVFFLTAGFALVKFLGSLFCCVVDWILSREEELYD